MSEIRTPSRGRKILVVKEKYFGHIENVHYKSSMYSRKVPANVKVRPKWVTAFVECWEFILFLLQSPMTPDKYSFNSIFITISAWAPVSPRKADSLLNGDFRASEKSIMTLSIGNKTLGENYLVELTRHTLDLGADFNQRDGLIDDFLAKLPESTRKSVKLADPMAYINRVFPVKTCPRGARYLAGCFWTWLCIVDDLTEDGDTESSLEACIRVLSQSPFLKPTKVNSTCMRVMEAFRQAVEQTSLGSTTDPEKGGSTSDTWKLVFWNEVLIVCKALQAEQPFLKNHLSMRNWLELRLITISARPFFVLFRASLNLPCSLNDNLSSSKGTLGQLQVIMQGILGLQNDILGWEKDHRNHHRLNAVEILIGDGATPSDAFHTVLNAHNDLMRLFIALKGWYQQEMRFHSGSVPAEMKNLELLSNFGHGMADWMLKCGRYLPDATISPVETSPTRASTNRASIM